jgi:hypothetical protein
MKLSTLDIVALVLVIIGGLNWLLVALGYNLVTMIFGSIPSLVTIVYLLVGIAAIYLVVIFAKLERK